MLHLYTSNRTERLADVLAEILRTTPGGVFERETIVVQNRGMARWLSLYIAETNGMAVNLEFPFPRTFLYNRLFRPLSPELAEAASAEFADSDVPFSPEIMTWEIFRDLPGYLDDPVFAALRAFVVEDGHIDPLRLFQISARIAALYDQYLTYRPEMTLGWQGRELDWTAADRKVLWQRRLWETMAVRHHEHFAALYAHARERLRSRSVKLDLPRRVFLFGFSTIPPAYIHLFHDLGTRTEVHLFHLSACRQYWEDVRTEKRVLRAVVEKEEDALYEIGNPLLGSCGKVGREFLVNVMSLEEVVEPYGELYEEPPATTLLGALQGDILDMTVPSAPVAVPADACNLRLNVCYSPMREVEVLYDYLLDCFETLPGLLPKDVLVLCPDIATYAPLIEAVFGTCPPGDRKRIFATVADRSVLSESPEVTAYLNILKAVNGRFRVSEVWEIFSTEAIYRRFGVDEDGLETIRTWLRDTHVNWGLDEEYRAETTGVAFAENSWQWAFDRMLLGYALSAGDDDPLFLFEGADGELRRPYANIEGGAGVLLGAFVEFLHSLRLLHRDLTKPVPVPGASGDDLPSFSRFWWAETLRGVVDAFFDTGDDFAEGLQSIRHALGALDRHLGQAGYGMDAVIQPAVVQEWLRDTLDATPAEGGFFQGGVTFCRFQPMRSVPARVICMLGMNETDFPRHDRRLSFDLLSEKPQPCDRRAKDDDRYVFLEAILAARDRLCISYVGRDIKTNDRVPPSVLVSELRDTIDRGYVLEKDDGSFASLTDWLTVEHPLQAFSPRYFRTDGDSRLFSFSRPALAAAQRIESPGPVSDRVGIRLLGEIPEAFLSLTLDELIAFFCNPCKYLLVNRLHVYLDVFARDLPDDREPFAVDPLERYLQAQAIAGGDSEEHSFEQLLAVFRGEGRLPVGDYGTTLFRKLYEETRPFAARVQDFSAERLEPFEADLTLPVAGTTVSLGARFENLYRSREGAANHVLFRYAVEKARDTLRAWLGHVVLAASGCSEVATTSVLHRASGGGAEAYALKSLSRDAATRELTALLELYLRGLDRPLPFFPQAMRAFQDSLAHPKTSLRDATEAAKRDAAWAAARKVWEGGYQQNGEGQDAYLAYCFGAGMPETGFAELAKAVYGTALSGDVRQKREV